jgi:mycothiol synthase
MGHFGLRVIPCPADAKGEALELIYRKVPTSLRDRLIVQMLEEERRGEIDLSGLWVATTRRGRIAGAMLTQPLVGKAAAVWAPEVRRGWRRDNLAAAMVKMAVESFAARGFRLIQSVLEQSASPQARRDLEKGGLPRVTELLYLERSTAIPLDPAEISSGCAKLAGNAAAADPASGACSPADFTWRSFIETPEHEFRSTLQATYTGSLDMPELEGARSLDDILESYKSVGRFKAEHWRLGHIPGDPGARAVLLLAEVPGRDVWEVIYLGLTPAARGRRLGRVVLEHALALARGQIGWLELAVDARNTPAIRLYYSAGFTACERRAIHLTTFSEFTRGVL